MSSRDPPDDKGKREARQKIGSRFQKAKDTLKRPWSPRPPAGTSKHNPCFDLWNAARVTGISILHRKAPGGATRSRLTKSLHELENSVETFPPLKSAVGAFIGCLDTALIADSNRADYEELANDFESIASILKQYSGELKSESSTGSIAYIARSIQDQVTDIKKQNERKTIGRLFDAIQDQEDVVRRYRYVDRLFRQLQCDLTMRTKDTVEKQLETTLLRGMFPVDDARYNSSYSMTIKRRGCTAETREAIRQALQAWTTDAKSEKIYWMNGMAGTGKTTIAYSYCEWLESTQRLGASFFCSRISSTCRSLTQIVPTIAYQLARYSPAFRSGLCAALKDNPDAATLNVMQQFEKLISQPMLNCADAIPDGVVVLIDALDECDDSYSVRLLLDVLLKFADRLPLRFFVSSRPEHAIRDKMMSQGGAARTIVYLHDIEDSIVEDDIKKYLNEAFLAMSPPPSDKQVAILAKRSRNLFIYAATVVRYISPGDIHVDSAGRMKSMLATISNPKSISKNKYDDLDRLYTTVLRAAYDKRLEDDERDRMQQVLWTVVCAKEPMLVNTIASLTNLDEQQVWAPLQSLRSVVHVPENNSLISTLHASFPEYMLNESRSGEFYCDESRANERLVHRFFDIMRSELRFNICRLTTSYLTDDQVEDLETRVSQCISPALLYACRYWSSHLLSAPVSTGVGDEIIDFLSNRLLFWMEVLSLSRCIGTGAPMMQQVQTWLRKLVDTADEVQKRVSDARNFVTLFAANPCSRSTPHIYISALPLCAKSNWVHQHYSRRIQVLARIPSSHRNEALLANWVLESTPSSMAVSPDGNHICVGYEDGSIQIHDFHTGALAMDPFRVHKNKVYSVAFSPDGSLIASGSDDNDVIIWDAQTGRIFTGPLHGHTQRVWSVAFSPDGSQVVSGSGDRTVVIWNTHSGDKVMGPLRGHSKEINSVAFSPSGRLIASASDDHTIILWDADTGATVHEPLTGHKNKVWMVAFSPGGSHLASCSIDTTIRLWDVPTGTQVAQLINAHKAGVRSLSFSSDGTYIVSGGYEIVVWDTHTHTAVVDPFRGHTGQIRSVAFLPDNALIVSCSENKTIRIWDFQNKAIAPSESLTRELSVGPVAFTPDRTQFVSASSTGALHLWDTYTSAPISSSFEGQAGQRSIQAISLSSHETQIVASANDSVIRVWDVATGDMICQRLTGHKNQVTCLTFSPDGACICSGSEDCTIIVWIIETGVMRGRPYEGHTGSVHSVAYSPNGTRIASGATDRTVRVWNPITGRLIHTLSGYDSSIESVGFSPDGRYIVSGSDDKYVRIWEFQAPSDPAKYELWKAVKCVTFSPDGTRVIAGFGSIIYVLNSQLTELLSWLHLPSGETVHWVGFCPDGTSIISVSVSGNDVKRQATEGTDCHPPQQPNIIRVWQADARPPGWSPSSASGSWSYEDDGRILSPDGFVLWVPPDVFPYLGKSYRSYRCSFVLSSDGIIDLRFKDPDLCIGERWAECYVDKD